MNSDLWMSQNALTPSRQSVTARSPVSLKTSDCQAIMWDHWSTILNQETHHSTVLSLLESGRRGDPLVESDSNWDSQDGVIAHPSQHYVAFYYSFRWGRFNLSSNQQVVWLQLLFSIKCIGLEIIGFCSAGVLFKDKTKKAGAASAFAWFNIQDGWPLPLLQNTICPLLGMTPVFMGWQWRGAHLAANVTGDDDRRGHRSAKTQWTAWEWNFPVMESPLCSGMALQAARRELSRMDLSGMLTHSPKLMECQSKGKRNGGKGATWGLAVGGFDLPLGVSVGDP